MLTAKIEDWLGQFRSQYFFYRDGFWRLPYKGNAPHLLITSFDHIPFIKKDKQKQKIFADTPLFAGSLQWQQLEEGCWVFYTRMKYKINVCFALSKDKGATNDFMQFSLNAITPKSIVFNGISEKPISFPKYSWSFQKATEDSHIKFMDLKFAGSDNRHVMVYCNQEWFNKNLVHSSLFRQSKLEDFFQSEQRFLHSPIQDENYILKQFELFEKMFGIGAERHPGNDLFGLKLQSLSLVNDFFDHCKTADVAAQHYVIDDEGQETISKIENYLTRNLFADFPGIEVLAEKFKISESKLKTSFKQLFGKPLYQYFQAKQMQLAKELLKENKLLVKEVANKFGYSNIGKFSAAFKKHHGVLPSEYILPNPSDKLS